MGNDLVWKTLRFVPGLQRRYFGLLLYLHIRVTRTHVPFNVNCFLFLKDFFLSGVPLSKDFHRGEPDGREPFPFPLDSRLIPGSCFIPHFCLRAWTFRRPLCEIFNVDFLLPLDLPLAAAAPKAGCSSCLSRDEKCFSRTFCSRYQTTVVFSLVQSLVAPF